MGRKGSIMGYCSNSDAAGEFMPIDSWVKLTRRKIIRSTDSPVPKLYLIYTGRVRFVYVRLPYASIIDIIGWCNATSYTSSIWNAVLLFNPEFMICTYHEFSSWYHELNLWYHEINFWYHKFEWKLCDRPRNGLVNKLRIESKYKYKHAHKSESEFDDKLSELYMSKNMEDFWLQWNSKFSKQSTSPPNINGLFDNDDIANVFCDTFSASQYDSYADSVKFVDCLKIKLCVILLLWVQVCLM